MVRTQTEPRLLFDLAGFNIVTITVAVDMPHNFIWVHLDAATRIETLKVDSSRLERQLVETDVLDKMHTEVANPHSGLLSMQLTMRTLRGGSYSQQQKFSSSFADGMSQVPLLYRYCNQYSSSDIIGSTAAKLSL